MVKNLQANQIVHYFNDNRVSEYPWNQSSTTIVIELSADDEVWLICINTSDIVGNVGGQFNFLSHFSGFLIDEK
ncbi:hypothetical protein DPMN_041734 [Dreissena polymorpha]|uniref:C1q domain-containing protein n=1 Tax=Dreissena polymorpha TaxID=45954 RepID=A0A9D4CYD1_DREPO|nr:hypothetical protein DPMN_041734 [Dreissena polymorpha]